MRLTGVKTIKNCLQKHGSSVESASAEQLPFQSYAGCRPNVHQDSEIENQRKGNIAE